MRDSKAFKFIIFIYPYVLYHLYILFNWLQWSKIPPEISTYFVMLFLIIAECLLFLMFKRGEKGEGKYISFLISTFFLLLPLLFVQIVISDKAWYWVRWFVAFFYINHAVLLDYSLFGMLLLGFASILVAVAFYRFISSKPKVIFGFYLPWFVFMSPLFFVYIAGGSLGGDITKYKYIEPVFNPLKEVEASVLAPPGPRGIYIEDDTIFTAYETTIHASIAEKLLFVYRMDTGKLITLKLPGTGVRRIYSRATDPYIYVSIWKWNPGFFRINKKELNSAERLLDLYGGAEVSKGIGKIYQIGNIYVDSKGEFAYLIADSYPAVGKFDFGARNLEILDFSELGFCPFGSILGFMPAVDPNEKYMYLALTDCYCGVVKIDLNKLSVVGCYEIKSPRQGFYGVVFYRDGLLYCFPVVKYYKTLVLDAESMRKVGEFDKPPFHYIRDVIELDSSHILCLGFFGSLAIFDMRTGKYTTLIRKDLSLSMGLFRYGDYIYFNTARHGILRIKAKDLLALEQ